MRRLRVISNDVIPMTFQSSVPGSGAVVAIGARLALGTASVVIGLSENRSGPESAVLKAAAVLIGWPVRAIPCLSLLVPRASCSRAPCISAPARHHPLLEETTTARPNGRNQPNLCY